MIDNDLCGGGARVGHIYDAPQTLANESLQGTTDLNYIAEPLKREAVQFLAQTVFLLDKFGTVIENILWSVQLTDEQDRQESSRCNTGAEVVRPIACRQGKLLS